MTNVLPMASSTTQLWQTFWERVPRPIAWEGQWSKHSGNRAPYILAAPPTGSSHWHFLQENGLYWHAAYEICGDKEVSTLIAKEGSPKVLERKWQVLSKFSLWEALWAATSKNLQMGPLTSLWIYILSHILDTKVQDLLFVLMVFGLVFIFSSPYSWEYLHCGISLWIM